MQSNAAVDTNVIIHMYDPRDAAKQAIALDLLAQGPVVSQPVISECFNVLRRLLQLPKRELLDLGLELFAPCTIVPLTHQTLTLAARLLARYDFQLFDSLVVAAALEADCPILYSADFQHNQLIEGRLRIVNPFR